MEFRLLDTSQLRKLELPSADIVGGFGLERKLVMFHVAPIMRPALAEAFAKVCEIFPLGFTVLRTFLTSTQQQDLFAEYKTGKTPVIAAPAHFSAREVGRAVDIAFSEKFCHVDDDGETNLLTMGALRLIMEPLGFICVDDGRITAKPWMATDGYIHLEYWADVGTITQTQRDAYIKTKLSELY